MSVFAPYSIYLVNDMSREAFALGVEDLDFTE